MSVVILTHPFYGNYGGMLQAYALQRVLEQSGFQAPVCQYYEYPKLRFFKRVKYSIYERFQSVAACYFPKLYKKSVAQMLVCRMGKKFLRDNVNSAPYDESSKAARAWVVGSDQVWRSEYARQLGGLPFFCLSQLPQEIRRRSIAYSASFGTDEWDASPDEEEVCRPLIREFKAVSVREFSGVDICRERLGVAAVQMPDPTLLPLKEEYDSLISREKTWIRKSEYVAAYILDMEPTKEAVLREGADSMSLPLQHLMPQVSAKKFRDRRPISVSQWLRLIRDCKYFITDSFHGCVFAIIFNKPFVCLGNELRGNARFESLLGVFGLKDRLLANPTPSELRCVLCTPIDWERVNAIHDSERERGVNFLRECLAR